MAGRSVMWRGRRAKRLSARASGLCSSSSWSPSKTATALPHSRPRFWRALHNWSPLSAHLPPPTSHDNPQIPSHMGLRTRECALAESKEL